MSEIEDVSSRGHFPSTFFMLLRKQSADGEVKVQSIIAEVINRVILVAFDFSFFQGSLIYILQVKKTGEYV